MKNNKTNGNNMPESFLPPIHVLIFPVVHHHVLYYMTFVILYIFCPCLDSSRVTSSSGFWLTKWASGSSVASSDRLWRNITGNLFYLR